MEMHMTTLFLMICYAMALMLRSQHIWSHGFYAAWMGWMIGLAHPSPDFDWHNLIHPLLLLYIVQMITVVPTNGLMTCIHGKLPQREDGKWQWMQDAATIIAAKILPFRFDNPPYEGFAWGIIYGAVRALPTLPAAIYLFGSLGLVVLLHGLLFFLCGRISQTNGVLYANGITGAIMGVA